LATTAAAAKFKALGSDLSARQVEEAKELTHGTIPPPSNPPMI
jgi:hypothetical protein